MSMGDKLILEAKKKMIEDHFYFMNRYADDYRFPKETIRISLTYLVRPIAKGPHKFFEFLQFIKELQKSFPSYVKQIFANSGPLKVFFLSVFSLLVRDHDRIRSIDRLPPLFEENHFFLKTQKV